MFGGYINDQINFGQKKTYFWAGLVEVGKINTYSPLSPFWGDDDGVCEPVWVMEFPDHIGFDELCKVLKIFFLIMTHR